MNNLKRTIRVVGAAIVDNGRVLVARRPFSDKAYKSLKWEFPGGKVETGETNEQAVVRECMEELGVTLKVDSFFMDVTHEYPDRTVHLSVYNCSLTDSEPVMLEHNDMRWITASECSEFEFCPADIEIMRRLTDGK